MRLPGLCIWLGLIPILAPAQAPAAKPSQPIADIGAFQFLPEGVTAGRIPGTTGIVPPCMRVEFKIKDKSVTKLNAATVYLFDKDGKLVKALTQIDPSGYLPIPTTGGTPRKPAGKFQNMITGLFDLRPGTTYNLIFPSPDKKEWKLAVAVIGDSTIPSCVYKTMPTNVDIKPLDFKEKTFAIKN